MFATEFQTKKKRRKKLIAGFVKLLIYSERMTGELNKKFEDVYSPLLHAYSL